MISDLDNHKAVRIFLLYYIGIYQNQGIKWKCICTKIRLIYKNAQTSTISIPTIRSSHDLNKHLLPNTSNLDFYNERNCLHSDELSSKMWHALSFLLKISIGTILLNYTKSNLTVQTITQLCIRLRYNNKYIFFTIYV